MIRFLSALLVLMVAIGVSGNRSRAADKAPFEEEIRAFEDADVKQPPAKDAILFVGSSSIKYWDSLAEDFPGVRVVRRGFGGSQIADSTRFADRIIIPYRPSRVLLYAGDNDIAAGRTPQEVLAAFQEFVKKVHASLPSIPITFISIKPSIARWKLIDQIKEANRLVQAYTGKESSLSYIDIFTPMLGSDGHPRRELLREDGLHCSRQGYALWAAIIAPSLH